MNNKRSFESMSRTPNVVITTSNSYLSKFFQISGESINMDEMTFYRLQCQILKSSIILYKRTDILEKIEMLKKFTGPLNIFFYISILELIV